MDTGESRDPTDVLNVSINPAEEKELLDEATGGSPSISIPMSPAAKPILKTNFVLEPVPLVLYRSPGGGACASSDEDERPTTFKEPKLPKRSRRSRRRSRERSERRTSQSGYQDLRVKLGNSSKNVPDLREKLNQGNRSRRSRESDETLQRRMRSLSRRRKEDDELLERGGENVLTFEANSEQFLGYGLGSNQSRRQIVRDQGPQALKRQQKWIVNSLDPRVQAKKVKDQEIERNERDPDGNPTKPIMDPSPLMYHGHMVFRIRPGDMVRMRCNITQQLIWLPLVLVKDDEGNDLPFKKDILTKVVTLSTAKTFLTSQRFVNKQGTRVDLLQIYNVPKTYQFVQVRTFLSDLQKGYRNFDEWKVGVCPHVECMSCILVVEGGHFCRALKDKWTPCYIARKHKRAAIQQLACVDEGIKHDMDLPNILKDLAAHR